MVKPLVRITQVLPALIMQDHLTIGLLSNLYLWVHICHILIGRYLCLHKTLFLSPLVVPSLLPFPGQPTGSLSPFSGCVMYPSPLYYYYGNPGYHYDSFQFPNCVSTQTNGNAGSNTMIPHVHNTCTPPTPTHPLVTDLPPVSPYDVPHPTMTVGSRLPTKDNCTYVPTSPVDQAHTSTSSPILDMNFPDNTTTHNNDVCTGTFLPPPSHSGYWLPCPTAIYITSCY